MKIYLDTANVQEIEKAAQTYLLDGVTTNPSLIAKEGRDFKREIKEIVAIMKKYSNDFTVSAEVTHTQSHKDMVKEGLALSKLSKYVIVKIPLTKEGLIAVKILSKQGIRCNVTLCFSVNQAILAAKAGAWCVSPFVGRVGDEGYDGVELVEDIKRVYYNYMFKTRILAASIRSVNDITRVAQRGTHIVTIPYKLFEKMYYNPLTDLGIQTFEKDWKEYEKKR